MLTYPQSASGALAQFPTIRKRRARTILNSSADGGFVKLGDPAGASTEWQLSYTALSDSELAALEQFFQAAEGSLNSFTFLDPNSNLLAWSEVLTNSAWTPGPQLTLQGGVADAVGGTNGWHLSNTGGGPEALSQTLNGPGGYLYCLSVYVQAVQPSSVTLTAGNTRLTYPAGATWQRIWTAGTGDASGTSIQFGIELPAGAAVDVFGPQVEAQAVPSVYRTSTSGGIYANARFRDDVFLFTTQGPNRHSATVNILYASHI